jgi:hypothetical protein
MDDEMQITVSNIAGVLNLFTPLTPKGPGNFAVLKALLVIMGPIL